MRTQIKRLHMAFGATSVYVTHDQTEAMTLADRIVALRDGRIEQLGTPDDLYLHPANRFVAGFIGSPTMNFLNARLDTREDAVTVTPAGGAPLPVPPSLARRYRLHGSRDVVFGMRPEDLTNTWTDERHEGAGAVPVDIPVDITEPLGSDKLVFGRLGHGEVIARITAAASPASGSTVRLHAHMAHMHLFDPNSGEAL
jgi:multiple sugar transport system ATP-binding protein